MDPSSPLACIEIFITMVNNDISKFGNKHLNRKGK